MTSAVPESRRLVTAAILTAALAVVSVDMAAAQTAASAKPRPPATVRTQKPAPVQSETRVYLLRGLLNIFSLGMDDLAEKLKQRGVKAEVYNHDNWPSIASEVIEAHKRGDKGPFVFIGHSLGADVLFPLAERLDAENVPVALVVPYDPTASYQVPKNVSYLLNFYQLNGWGRKVAPGPGFKGKLENLDLSKDESIGHGSIDKSARLHALTITRIMEVAGKARPAPKARKTPVATQDVTGSTTPLPPPSPLRGAPRT
jgi:hypothetical protein